MPSGSRATPTSAAGPPLTAAISPRTSPQHYDDFPADLPDDSSPSGVRWVADADCAYYEPAINREFSRRISLAA
jgi:hypothetical protein